MKKILLTVVLILGVASVVFAGSPNPPFVPGIRPLGMGGAFLAVADDTNVLFYNPAGLGRIDYTYVSILDQRFETSQDVIDLAKWFLDNQDRLFEKHTDTQGSDNQMQNLTTDDINRLTSIRAKFRYDMNIFSLVMHNIGAGLYAYANVDVGIRQMGLFDMRLDGTLDSDIILPVSYGREIDVQAMNDFFDTYLAGGRLYAGGTVKVFQRRNFDEQLSLFEMFDYKLSDEKIDELKSGKLGFGVDIGTLYHVPQLHSNFAIVVRDLYTHVDNDTVKGNLGFGYAYRPTWRLGPVSDILFAADINGINDGNLTLFNKLHLGAEAWIIGVFGLRIGAYQGYPTFGVSIARVLQYANYSVEKGHYPGQIEERRHTVSLGINF